MYTALTHIEEKRQAHTLETQVKTDTDLEEGTRQRRDSCLIATCQLYGLLGPKALTWQMGKKQVTEELV